MLTDQPKTIKTPANMALHICLLKKTVTFGVSIEIMLTSIKYLFMCGAAIFGAYYHVCMTIAIM